MPKKKETTETVPSLRIRPLKDSTQAQLDQFKKDHPDIATTNSKAAEAIILNHYVMKGMIAGLQSKVSDITEQHTTLLLELRRQREFKEAYVHASERVKELLTKHT